MVNWAQTTQRIISQQTFDEAVQDNINDFEMALDEAIQEARSQFEAQGVDLTTILGERRSVMDDLNLAIAAKHEDDIMNVLKAIDDDEARGLADQGLIGALLLICREYHEQKPLVMASLNVLLVSTKFSVPSMVPEPGLISLLECLRHHINDIQIQTRGLKILAQVVGGFEPHKNTIHSNGFNDYICDILTKHQAEHEVFLRACNVIKRYLSDDDRRPGVHPHTFTRARELAAMNDSEIISKMLSALKQNTGNPAYVSAICATLRCIAVTDAICQAISRDVLGDLIQIAKLHFDRDNVVEKTFSLFKIMSRNDQVKVSVCSQEGVELAMLTLKHHTSNQKVISQVVGMMAAITLRQPENCLMLANNGIIPLLVSVMSGNSDHIAIQRGAISTLRNMVSSSRTKQLADLILEENAEELICKAHDTHEQCKDVAYAALRDLGRPYKATWNGIDS